MVELTTTWLSSIIDNAPYLAGAVVAIVAMWKELKECRKGNERIAQRLLDHIIEARVQDVANRASRH